MLQQKEEQEEEEQGGESRRRAAIKPFSRGILPFCVYSYLAFFCGDFVKHKASTLKHTHTQTHVRRSYLTLNLF